MRSTTRHHLKQDQFAATVTEQFSWAVEHRNTLVYVGSVLIAVLVIVFGGWWYLQQRDQEASVALSAALRTYEAPIVAAGTPAPAGMEVYNSIAARSEAAKPKFQDIINKYSHTHTAAVAQYFLGLTSMDSGDNATAERALNEASKSGDDDLAALAKMALANLYRDSGRDQQAIDMYKQLSDHPTNTVTKASAQMAQADIYAKKDPGAAKKLYEEIAKDNPNTAAANVAQSKIGSLK